MITGNISTGVLKDLLAFESEKYAIPVVVVLTDLNNYENSVVIRKAVEVYINSGTGITKELSFKDNKIVLTNVYLPYFVDASEDGIYGVLNNKVFIGFDLESYSCEPWFNSLFASIFDKVMPTIKTYIDNEAKTQWQEQYFKLKQFALKEQIRTMKSDIESNSEEIEAKLNEIKEFSSKNYTLSQAIASIENLPEGIIRRKAATELESLMELTPDPVSHIELSAHESRVSVYTNEIYIDYEDYDYYMGRFRIDIQLSSSVIKITNLEKPVKGYHHPHVSQDGTPCLGNISSTVYYLMLHQDIYQLVTLLIQFLKSYNEQNPYLKINYWDPDYEDENDPIDRYESCYEDSSAYDCVICQDSNCPYHEEAQERCHEARQNPNECINCTADCIYSGNYDACFTAQMETDTPGCRACTYTDCPHHTEARRRA